ncbi:hypothetical protein LCGC14_2657580 [marine sediment metagenome]|uniref:Uncharacterized protein n=1 Tax=marine sediment metagenome TaxID=412755 RepID=A0A0F9AFA3_9ZZZZ
MTQSNIQFEQIGLATEKGRYLDCPFCSIISRNTTRGIKMKTCSKCKQIKAFSDFYKNISKSVGLQNYCKACQKAYQQSPKGLKVSRRACYKYQRTKKGRQAHCKANKHFGVRNPSYIKANSAVKSAIRANRLPRPNTLNCRDCPAQANQYHHPDYSKPFEVVALCKNCHIKIHIKIA